MTGFIDSHAHLAADAFNPDRDEVIGRARAAGALHVICIGESIEASTAAEALSRHDPALISFTAGIHPHDAVGFDADRDLAFIRGAVDRGAVAIGECGLDYHYDHSPRSAQIETFRRQLEIAAELSRPAIVHTRDAEDDTRELVCEAASAGVRGVLHCYTGSAGLAEHALSLGWYVSFSGIVTFKAWTDIDLLRLVPHDRLLVESDAPYLAPVPMRGRRNEPALVSHTVRRLATVRGVESELLAQQTARNAITLFGLATGTGTPVESSRTRTGIEPS